MLYIYQTLRWELKLPSGSMSERLPPPRTKAEDFRAKAKTAELKPKTSELKPKNARSNIQEAHSNESSHLARCLNCCPRPALSRYDLKASAQNEAPDPLELKTSKLP